VAGPINNPDSDLFAHLRLVEDRMLEIFRDGLLVDPDRIMQELQSETDFVQTCVNELMAELDDHPERFTNLNRLADLASRELLMTIQFPVVIKTTADPTLPDLKYADEVVLAAILRALQLCAEHAGPGCQIHVRTGHDNNRARFTVQTNSVAPFKEPTLPIKLRSISLADLVRTFGGEIRVAQDRNTLTFSLLLAVDAPTT
jgi:hypothetical protein